MRNVKSVKVGNCVLDGKHIYIQSMLNVNSNDIEGSVKQAKELEDAGCEIIRIAIPDMNAIKLIPAIKEKISVPLVADIHFDYKLALEAVSAGIDKVRINPGNIGSMDRVKQVADACRSRNIPIRIGVNSGSLEKEILAEYGSPTPEAMVKSAMRHIEMLNRFDFDDIVVSIKSSDVKRMIKAYRLMAETTNYPLHLGVTEAGTERMGLIKSAVGIGSLLADGIGETIRVSLTDDPVKEIYAGIDILKALGLRRGIRIVACPTCGRTRIDLVGLAKEVESAINANKAYAEKDLTVAVMGCVVNGIGEGKEADIGVAGGDGCGVIFRKGEIVKKVVENEIIRALLNEIDSM